jgi:hypothetical protein
MPCMRPQVETPIIQSFEGALNQADWDAYHEQKRGAAEAARQVRCRRMRMQARWRWWPWQHRLAMGATHASITYHLCSSSLRLWTW